MNPGEQFEAIIGEKISTLPIKEVADVFIDKVEADSQVGVDPTGQPYTSYATSTAKRKGYSTPDMRDKSRSIETVDTLYEQAMEARIGFSGNAGYGSTSRPASDVFFRHQQGGEWVRGGKQRKVFLEDEDLTSPGANEAIERVEILLEEHFNE